MTAWFDIGVSWVTARTIRVLADQARFQRGRFACACVLLSFQPPT
jgi:hypothetical protein